MEPQPAPVRARPASWSSFGGFVGVGSLCYGLSLGLLWFATRWLGAGHLQATVVAGLLVAPLSWWLNRTLTFHSTEPGRAEFARFVLATATSIALAVAGMALLVDGAGLPIIPANLITTALVTIAGYTLMRIAVFVRGDLPAPAPSPAPGTGTASDQSG